MWLLLSLSTLVATICVISSRPTDEQNAGASLARHILHIGIDGLKPACIANSSTGSPNILKRLGGEGTFTLTNARTTIQTVSAPGWSTTLCAMDPTSTGVIGNNWSPPWLGFKQPITPVTGDVRPFPCVFETIKKQDHNVRTASFYNWDWLNYLMNHGIPNTLDHDYFCNVTSLSWGECDTYIGGNASAYLNSIFRSPEVTKSYTFVYFGNVDETGHGKTWCGIEYEKEVGKVDALVGDLLDVIEQAGMKDEVLVLLSADHGGEGYGHGNQDDACLIIPMFIRGPSVKRNYQFKFSVRNMDIVPTGLYVLGLKPNEMWKGLVMEEAFENVISESIRSFHDHDEEVDMEIIDVAFNEKPIDL